jgi:hypothetical protein
VIIQLKVKVIAAPVMLHGCENWALSIKDKRRTEAAEMRFFYEKLLVTLRDCVIRFAFQLYFLFIHLGSANNSSKK